MHSRVVIQRLQDDGWYKVAQVGSHVQFKHPVKEGAGHGATPEPKHTDRHSKKYRAASKHQTEVSMDYMRIFIRTVTPTSESASLISPAASPLAERWKKHGVELQRLSASTSPGMVEDGARIPDPSTVDDVLNDPAIKDAVAFLVPAVWSGRFESM